MNIIIVGGGTAGWLAAYFLVMSKPKKHNITVIESSKIGIIGAGEGSTGTMLELLSGQYFDHRVDIIDFMKHTDSTIKLGIRHENWSVDKDSYFAPLDGSPTWFEYDDKVFKYAFSKYGKEKLHLASYIGHQYENRNFSTPPAFHFDGKKVGDFFKKQCNDAIKLIDSEVNEIELNDNGFVKSVIINNGEKITGDFFIDCSGFSRLLMKKMQIKWLSYKKFLPVDSAIPFIVNYEDNETINPYTKASALSSGWMWEIPLISRKGCGYVFDSNFISPDQAIKEVSTHLNKKIEPIKLINFESGKSENFWEKNVLSLGLSSIFLEPLEATSIHITILQLLQFVKESLFDTIEQTSSMENIISYNNKIHRLCDLTMDFISFHYQGGRKDTKFWNYIQNENIISENARIYKEKCKHHVPGFLEINGIIGSPCAGLWNYIAAGLGILKQSTVLQNLTEENSTHIAESMYNKYFKTKSYIEFLD
jgi:hypothetical protein